MEHRILEILRHMQEVLSELQLQELKTVLNVVFTGCEIVEETGIQIVDREWEIELEDFLISKTLEGKSSETVQRYRYELKRLLSYINKKVPDITAGDISGYMRAYKRLRNVSNQTLQNVRAVYSSFFGWLRDRDKIRKNPITLVENIKTEKVIKKTYTCLLYTSQISDKKEITEKIEECINKGTKKKVEAKAERKNAKATQA